MRSPEAYLRSTRRIRPEYIAKDHYNRLFGNVKSVMKNFEPLPEFYVTNSTSRMCETVDLGQGAVVIFDQCLGQSFNQLNRMFLNSQDPAEMTAYAFKLMAEHAQLTGNLELSLSFAVSYRKMQKRTKATHRQDVDLKRRMTIGWLQELYVIVHEVMHSVLRNQPDWRVAAIASARTDYITNYRLPMLEMGLVDGAHDKGNHDKYFLDEVKLFIEDDALVEECVCDTLAIPVVWTLGQKLCDAATCRSAIFFALRHLRLLAILRHYVDRISKSADAESLWLTPYLARTGFLQRTIRQFEAWADMSSDASDLPFMAEQERYSKYVEDPVFADVNRRVKALSGVSFAAPDYSSIGEINVHIDKLIGNADIVDKIKNIGEENLSISLSDCNDSATNRIRALLIDAGLLGSAKAGGS